MANERSVSVNEDGGYDKLQRRERLMVRKRYAKRIAVFLTAITLMCLVCYYSEFPIQPRPQLPISTKQDSSKTNTYESKDMRNLEEILRDAATEDKTVIITTLNKAWAVPNSTFDLFLESFHVGEGTKKLLRHLVVMCLDKEAYSRCLEVHQRRCYFLKTTGVDFSGQKNYMTPDYLKMVWRRIEFLGSILKHGYSFISTDIDIMWLRDPFPHLFSEEDFQVSCDIYNGNSTDKRNLVNVGFKFVKANHRTVEFYKYWYASRRGSRGQKTQDVLNKIKYDQYITEKIGLTMRFLDTIYFRGFCQMSNEMNKVCTMHANCCGGLQTKIFYLRQVLDDWKNYLSAAGTTHGRKMTWRLPDNCRPRVRKSDKTMV